MSNTKEAKLDYEKMITTHVLIKKTNKNWTTCVN